MDAALACKVGLEADSEVVMTCLSLVARDLRDLFELYGAKVKWVLNESEVGDLFDSWEPDKRSIVLAELKDRFESKYDRVKTFLAEIGEQAEVSSTYDSRLFALLFTHNYLLISVSTNPFTMIVIWRGSCCDSPTT